MGDQLISARVVTVDEPVRVAERVFEAGQCEMSECPIEITFRGNGNRWPKLFK